MTAANEQAIAASQAGDHDTAIRLLTGAVAAHPGNRALLANLGLVYARAGRSAEAIEAYRAALAVDGSHAATLAKLGRVLAQAGRGQEAVAALTRAAALDPVDPAIANALGAALAGADPEQARRAFTRAVALDPHFEEAWINLGNLEAQRQRWAEAAAAFAHTSLDYERGVALGKLGRYDEAQACYRRVLAADPKHARAWNNLGHTLAAVDRHADAESPLRRALQLEPNYIDARYNLGVTLQALGRTGEARIAYQLVLAAQPHADTLNNLGGLCLSQAHPELAAPLYASALAANPNHPDARWNLALAQLATGDFASGWQNYESRPLQRRLEGPVWEPGISLQGRTLLLWCEQGLGDAIQFLRYIPVMESRGARVLLECPARLHPLLAWTGRTVIERGSALPAYDYHASAMSLPALLGTRLDTIPPPGPHYAIPAQSRDKWRKRLDALPPGRPRAGIVWGGSLENKKGLDRSMPLDALLPLARSMTLISLQHGPQSADALAHAGAEVAVWEQQDLCDTAALVAELDVVITVDTMMAHLAGTLARRVCVLLPYASDWRWMTNRADSPWYPNMRLCRQKQPGDWPSAVAQASTST